MCLSGGHSSPKESVLRHLWTEEVNKRLVLDGSGKCKRPFKSFKPFNRVYCFIRSEEQSEPELVL